MFPLCFPAEVSKRVSQKRNSEGNWLRLGKTTWLEQVKLGFWWLSLKPETILLPLVLVLSAITDGQKVLAIPPLRELRHLWHTQCKSVNWFVDTFASSSSPTYLSWKLLLLEPLMSEEQGKDCLLGKEWGEVELPSPSQCTMTVGSEPTLWTRIRLTNNGVMI